jgi:hypothetical protein
VRRFHSCLIFAGKAGNLPSEWRPIRGFTQVSFSLVSKY